MKLAILASGSGTNAKAIIEKAMSGVLEAEIAVVASDKPDARVLERAADFGISILVLEPRNFPDRECHDRELGKRLLDLGCDAVILAGYMRLVGRAFLRMFSGRVLNIHPALLPSFPGLHGARDAVDYGVKISGPSVHFVTEEMDGGPLIIQAAVPVMAGEPVKDLQNRIHALEHRIYPQAIQWLAQDRLRINGRIVFLEERNIPRVHPDGDWLVWPPLEEGF